MSLSIDDLLLEILAPGLGDVEHRLDLAVRLADGGALGRRARRPVTLAPS